MKKLFYTFLLTSSVAAFQPAFSTSCPGDTVRYPQAKATSYLYDINFDGSGQQIQRVGQYYPAPQSLTISAVEFHAFNTSSTKAINFLVELYNAGADSLPVGNPIAFIKVTNVTKPLAIDYATSKLKASFNNPLTIANPYVVVISTAGAPNLIAGIVSSNFKIAKPDGKKERLAEVYYNNVWSKADDIQLQPGGAGTKIYNLDCDFMIFPVVSYVLDAKFGYTPKTVCYDTSTVVNFSDSSSAILKSKFYNQNVFFKNAQKSYSWSFNGALLQTTSNPFYKFSTAGLLPVSLTDTLKGWTDVCVSQKLVTFAVNLTNASSDVSICKGSSVILSAKGALSYTWSPTPVQIIGNGDAIKVIPTKTTVFKVIGAVGNCTKTDSVKVIVNPVPVLQMSSTSSSDNNGTSTVMAMGGTPSTSGYLYKWNNNTSLKTSTISNLASGLYKVLVTDSLACSTSDSVTVTSVITGLSESNSNAQYSIYPNPATSELWINFNNNGTDQPGNVTIVNAQGLPVIKSRYNGSGNQSINIGSLPAGSYMLMFDNGAGNILRKINKVD